MPFPQAPEGKVPAQFLPKSSDDGHEDLREWIRNNLTITIDTVSEPYDNTRYIEVGLKLDGDDEPFTTERLGTYRI